MKLKLFLLFTLISIFFIGCNFNNSDSENDNNNFARGIFTITDAPNDELSVLQVELTELKIIDVEGNETLIFAETNGQTYILNLLDLQGLNALLGSVPLTPGLYKSLSLSYKNATALDVNGNVLTVKENHFGNAKVNLNPYLEVGTDNVYIEIDFDLNNSVFNIVSGPHGSLLLMPTLVVKISGTESNPELEEFKGIVHLVTSESEMIITVNGETIKIIITDDTIIEIDELIITPTFPGFEFSHLFLPGNIVEIYGTLDVATNTVTAAKIERLFENHALGFQGIVVNKTDLNFDVLVLGSRDSGYTLGSIQTVTFDNNTFFLYTDPAKAADFEKLAIGQDVRITGTPEDASAAQKVKLKETKIFGTIVSLNAALSQLVFTVKKIEGIDISNIPGFINPITVEFVVEFPSDLKVGAEISLEGFFNRETDGTFSVYTYDPDDEESGNETVNNTWVGKIFSVLSSSPPMFSITRGGSGGNIENRTVTVNVDSSTIIVEKNKSSTTSITAAELVDRINSGAYSQMKAKGGFNSSEKTLLATQIVMTVKKK